MAGDVKITRGVGYRDDALVSTGWSGGTGGNFSAPTISTDGDVLTFTSTATNAANNDYATVDNINFTTATNTCGQIIVRHKESWLAGNPTPVLIVFYNDSTQSVFSLTNSTSLVTESFTLTASKTVSQVSFHIKATGTLNGTFSMYVDFAYVFKEMLTLPAVSQPMPLAVDRFVAVLPIPTREGGILQDMGSQSAMIEVNGMLVTTSSPNNYTGDQWWDVLVGLQLEANWQWLTSDRVNYKYQIETLNAQQDPGKVGYYGFKMRLRKVDILSASAQTFGAIQ